MISEAARVYGEGLFALAKETHSVEEKKEQAVMLKDIISESDDLSVFLSAVRVSKEEKEKMIDKVFQNSLDRDMCNFLKLLVSKDRTYYLKEILGHFIALCNEELGIECAEVYSARVLAEEDYERICKALEKMRGRKIQMSKQIDPALIAGIRVRIGNTVMDASVEKQISDMKKNLLKGVG